MKNNKYVFTRKDLELIEEIESIFLYKEFFFDDESIKKLTKEENNKLLSLMNFEKVSNDIIEFTYSGDIKNRLTNNGFYNSDFNTLLKYEDIILNLSHLLKKHNKEYIFINDSTIHIFSQSE